jgi:hypothetical protein
MFSGKAMQDDEAKAGAKTLVGENSESREEG